jgi:SAM-dependent methyltransferase
VQLDACLLAANVDPVLLIFPQYQYHRLDLVLRTKKLSPRHRMECYTPGHSLNATAFMAVRTLSRHGAFIEPWLKPGLQVLDCGCGPGAIAVGLAEAVGSSGQVTAIDLAESQIAIAQARSAANLKFQVGSVYELPFDDNSFDLVFSHALFEHLARPIAGIREILRILRPGGVVGLCSPDWNGFVLSPVSERVEAAIHPLSNPPGKKWWRHPSRTKTRVLAGGGRILDTKIRCPL